MSGSNTPMNTEIPPIAATRSRRFRIIGIVLLVVVAGGFAFRSWFATWDRDRALALAQKGDFRSAEPLLLTAVEREPDELRLIQALAKGYLTQNEDAKAIPFLSRWIELRPTVREPLELRLAIYRGRELHELAWADCQRLLEIAPDDLDYHTRAASLLFALGKLPEAETACRYVWKHRPNDRPIQRLLSEILRAEKQFSEAESILKQLVSEQPNDFTAVMGLGNLYVLIDRPADAVPLFRRLVAEDPSRKRSARYQLALSLERSGQSEEARRVMIEVRALQDAEVLVTANELQPQNLDLLVKAAKVHLENKQLVEGVALLERVLAKVPDHVEANRLMANHFTQLNDPVRAAEYRRRAGITP